MNIPIIMVSVAPNGEAQYLLRPTTFDTKVYGSIFAQLVRDVAAMMESEEGLDARTVVAQIVEHLNASIDAPTPFEPSRVAMLQ